MQTFFFQGYDRDGQPYYKNKETGEDVSSEYLLYLGATLPLGETVVIKDKCIF